MGEELDSGGFVSMVRKQFLLFLSICNLITSLCCFSHPTAFRGYSFDTGSSSEILVLLACVD